MSRYRKYLQTQAVLTGFFCSTNACWVEKRARRINGRMTNFTKWQRKFVFCDWGK